MAKRLTKRQVEALTALILDGERTAYPGLRLDTLGSLAERKLVTATYGHGYMFSPQTAIKYKITNLGRSALTEQ